MSGPLMTKGQWMKEVRLLIYNVVLESKEFIFDTFVCIEMVFLDELMRINVWLKVGNMVSRFLLMISLGRGWQLRKCTIFTAVEEKFVRAESWPVVLRPLRYGIHLYRVK